MTSFMTQTAFSNLMGWDKAHTTRLKQEGRLVMDEAGKLVDVAASQAKIEETTSLGHKQGSEQRKTGEIPHSESSTGVVGTYQDSRALKMRFDALKAQAEYEQLMAKLLPREEVEQALDDLALQYRLVLDQIKYRIAQMVQGKSADEIEQVIADLVAELLVESRTAAHDALQELVKR